MSVGLHGGLFTLALFASLVDPSPMEFVTYQIEMVSPPPAVQAEIQPATEELVVEPPEPAPPIEEEPEQEVVPIEDPDDPEPEPSPEENRPTEELTEAEEEETPPAAPDPPPEEIEDSGEGINVRLEGVRRDYPAYYNNILRQIFNCFRWRGGGNWEATVFFTIEREGTVTDMRFTNRSGSTAFDFEAIGAVECAGQGRFGQLPDELPYDRLPVQFDFRPPGQAQELISPVISHSGRVVDR
jgi:outer membrane biosynthesis protein TonB